jgi:hypothetical protein
VRAQKDSDLSPALALHRFIIPDVPEESQGNVQHE